MMWDWYGPSSFFLFWSISTVLEFLSYQPVGRFLGCTNSTWSPTSDCGRDSSFPRGSGLQYCISYTKTWNANPHLGCKQLLRSTTLNFNAVKWKSLSPIQLFAITWTVACQGPLSMEFSRLKYWVGSHSLLQWIFPTQRLNPSLLHCWWILYHLSHQGIFSICTSNDIQG